VRRNRQVSRGKGTAWLVADRLQDDYLCYWYVGREGDHLAEWARQSTTAQALAWGRLRTSRVRIRTAEARTYWAGTAPRPEGFVYSWPEPAPAGVADPGPASLHGVDPTAPPCQGDDRQGREQARPVVPAGVASH
jgi:hypothetical protein